MEPTDLSTEEKNEGEEPHPTPENAPHWWAKFQRWAPHPSLAGWVALLISVTGVFMAYLVSHNIYENFPHIEDEIAYVWQANVIAHGDLTIASPVCPECFMVPFVIDHNGLRFGKYPPAWPVVLSFAIRLGLRDWVNPLLAGLGIWLTWRLGKKLFCPAVGVLAALLTMTSPFFLMNSGSLLSHPWSLFLSLAFALSWLDTFDAKRTVPRWLTMVVAGLTLGCLALTRPLTAIGVAIPFALHGLFLLWKGDKSTRLTVLGIGAITAAVASLVLVWQFAVTGDPFLNPYTLWWKYDTVGFGPGIGRQPGGFSLRYARINTKFALRVGYSDLFGWLKYSWIFLPVGLLASLRKPRALLVGSVIVSLVGVYMFYWISSWLTGPRYYYEGLFSATILSAAGIVWLAGPLRKIMTAEGKLSLPGLVRPALMTAIVTALLGANLMYYTPLRLAQMYGLYDMKRSQMEVFETPTALQYAPAIIVVKNIPVWTDYGVFLDLESPYLDSPFIFLYNPSPDNIELVQKAFPDRQTYYFYPDTPDQIFSQPR